jgi:tetratricopeptide (TPR) repeat protein
MDSNLDVHFSVPKIPKGEALTFDEIEDRCLKQLEEKEGKCVQSLINLAKLYSQAKLLDKASRCVERLIALSDDPEEHGRYYLVLGGFMEQVRDYQGAIGFYRQALALEPCRNTTWYLIHNSLGYSLNQLGNYDSAIPYLRRAIEIDPRRPNAYKNLGLAFEGKRNFEEAAELFVAATRADASDSRSLAHLESLISSHPELEVDLPDLPTRLEACREAVKIARAKQPDLQTIWAKDRQKQKNR